MQLWNDVLQHISTINYNNTNTISGWYNWLQNYWHPVADIAVLISTSEFWVVLILKKENIKIQKPQNIYNSDSTDKDVECNKIFLKCTYT